MLADTLPPSRASRASVRQQSLDFRTPLQLAPLYSINGVMGILRRDADDVLDLILDNKLCWAWNIGTTENRAEWRIWSKCVEDYQQRCASPSPSGRGQGEGQTGTSLLPDYDHDEVIAQLLGHTRSVLRGSEIRAVWTCDAQTITRHIRNGTLVVDAARNAARNEKNQTQFVTRASFEHFMYARCNKLCRPGQRPQPTLAEGNALGPTAARPSRPERASQC